MTKFKKTILIATGGTGGHVFPAYSLAKYFISNSFSIKIITDKRGYKFLKQYNELDLKIINSDTLFKKNPIKAIFSILKIFFAFTRSFIFLYKSKPTIVFGMGGYSCFPVCMAAKILKIPFIIYENNLFLGKTNKFLLPYANKIFVSYGELEGISNKYNLKKAEVGNILREEIFYFKKRSFDTKKDIIDILVLGGSQAARSFGEILPQIFKECIEKNIKIKVYQQCLPDQNDTIEKIYSSLNIEFKLFHFEHNLLKYFSKIDLAITRAGSSMMAELLNCNIPFICVPYPYSADNHQLKNAEYFKNKNYSFLVEEHEINSKLFPLIKSIHKDKDLLNQMKNKQKIHSDQLAFKKINDEIKKFIND